jgi:type I restriction enzyme S subunit
VNLADREYCIGRGLAAIVCSAECDPEFIFHSMTYAKPRLEAEGSGTTFQSVNRGTLDNFEIDLPPVDEQRSISSVLRAVQQATAATAKMIAATRELKQSLMRHLFTYGPVPISDAEGVQLQDTAIGRLPAHWVIESLGSLTRVYSGGTPDRSRPEYWGEPIPWVKTGEIKYDWITDTDERITEKGLSESSARIAPRGTILMAMYGQGITRGKVALLGIDAAINQACAAIEAGQDLDTLFLFFWLTHQYENIRALGHGANQKNLNASMIRALQVPVPPLSVQHSVAGALMAVDGKLRSEMRRRALLAGFASSVLAELMTGRRRLAPMETADV